MKGISTASAVLVAVASAADTAHGVIMHVKMPGKFVNQSFTNWRLSFDMYGEVADYPEVVWTLELDPWRYIGDIGDKHRPIRIDFDAATVTSGRFRTPTLETEPGQYQTAPIPLYMSVSGSYQILNTDGVESGTFATGEQLVDSAPVTIDTEANVAYLPKWDNYAEGFLLFEDSEGLPVRFMIQDTVKQREIRQHPVPEPSAVALSLLCAAAMVCCVALNRKAGAK